MRILLNRLVRSVRSGGTAAVYRPTGCSVVRAKLVAEVVPGLLRFGGDPLHLVHADAALSGESLIGCPLYPEALRRAPKDAYTLRGTGLQMRTGV